MSARPSALPTRELPEHPLATVRDASLIFRSIEMPLRIMTVKPVVVVCKT